MLYPACRVRRVPSHCSTISQQAEWREKTMRCRHSASLITWLQFGIGQPIPVFSLQSQFEVPLVLLWTDATDGTSSPSPSQIISNISSLLTPTQRQYVRQLSNVSDFANTCPQNFAGFSQCFAAVVFYDIPANGSATRPVNYTIKADAGLSYINVKKHTSHYEQRILPLQWAIDKVTSIQVNCFSVWRAF